MAHTGEPRKVPARRAGPAPPAGARAPCDKGGAAWWLWLLSWGGWVLRLLGGITPSHCPGGGSGAWQPWAVSGPRFPRLCSQGPSLPVLFLRRQVCGVRAVQLCTCIAWGQPGSAGRSGARGGCAFRPPSLGARGGAAGVVTERWSSWVSASSRPSCFPGPREVPRGAPTGHPAVPGCPGDPGLWPLTWAVPALSPLLCRSQFCLPSTPTQAGPAMCGPLGPQELKSPEPL